MNIQFISFIIVTICASACMSDKTCASLDSCCYMNRCVPLNSLECSYNKLDIFREINQLALQNNEQVKEAVESIRQDYALELQPCDR